MEETRKARTRRVITEQPLGDAETMIDTQEREPEESNEVAQEATEEKEIVNSTEKIESSTNIDEEYEDVEITSSVDYKVDDLDKKGVEQVLQDEKEEILNKLSKARVTQGYHDDYELVEGLNSASKRRKKKIYNDSSLIIPLNDELQVETEGQKRKKEFIKLEESRRTQKPLTGIVSGVKTINGRLIAVVEYGQFMVNIPAELFLVFSAKDEEKLKNPDEKEDYIRLLMNQRISSEVDFIIIGIDEEEMIATGDRVAAMNRIARNYYFGKNKRAEFILNRGSIVEARIVATTTISMTVEIFGREKRLKQDQISYTRIADVGSEYSVGDVILIKIMALERKKENGQLKLGFTVSAKEALEDSRARYYRMYEKNQLTCAKVTGIEEYGIFAKLEGSQGKLDVLCEFPRNDKITLPPVGSKLLVKITDKVEENYRIYGVIVRVLKVQN